MRPNSDDLDENFKPKKQKNFSFRAGGQTSTTKNIERQMVSVGDPISQKNATSGFTWDKILSKIY